MIKDVQIKENGTVILTVLPYTFHKLQSLDWGVFGAYKPYYNNALNERMIPHPGRLINIYYYNNSFIIVQIRKNFRVNGIFQLNEIETLG